MKNRQAQLAEIEIAGESLLDGETTRGITCPFCHSLEKAFAITRVGNEIRYICHRASCSEAGVIGGVHLSKTQAKRITQPGGLRLADIEHELVDEIPQDQKDIMHSKYGIAVEDMDFWMKWYPPRSRVALAIHSHSFASPRGYILRSLNGVQPKGLTVIRKAPLETPAFFYDSDGDRSTLLLVEDAFSAIRASHYVGAAALLGTNIPEPWLGELLRAKAKRYVLCLDNDALGKSVLLYNKYRDVLPGLSVVHPPKDLKDMKEDELKQFLTERGVV